jgi:hypothetical protein
VDVGQYQPDATLRHISSEYLKKCVIKNTTHVGVNTILSKGGNVVHGRAVHTSEWRTFLSTP